MEVLDVIENDDGTSTLTLEMTEEEKNMLIQYAIVKLLKEYIERKENE